MFDIKVDIPTDISYIASEYVMRLVLELFFTSSLYCS
jgi:hypothetical protein